MLLMSILNRVQLHPGFVYAATRFAGTKRRPVLEVEVRPRKNGGLFVRVAACLVPVMIRCLYAASSLSHYGGSRCSFSTPCDVLTADTRNSCYLSAPTIDPLKAAYS